MPAPHLQVAIVGAGFGGLGAAIRLRQQGVHDFLVFERASEVGGVWRDNTYPGCACDVQSHLYCFSFAPNPDWSRRYAPAAEIKAYLRRCAEDFGVVPHLRLGEDLLQASWDNTAQHWRLTTSRGEYTARVLVSGTGALSAPSMPQVPGLGQFEGPVFHSARWNHEVSLAGKRVAVVGTGASAIQFIPLIQPEVARLTLFQRTPPWVLPRFDAAISSRTRGLVGRARFLLFLWRLALNLTRELFVLGFLHPALGGLLRRLALRFLAHSVRDEGLRRKLTPDYQLGCKRILLSDDYLPAIQKENVEVLGAGLREVRAHSVVSSAGDEREVDAIIFGTGFELIDLPIAQRVRGRDGRTLQEHWAGTPKAHLGITVAGFPNFFLLLGPNTGLGHTSVVLMIESQLEHLLAALAYLREQGLAAVEPRAEAQAAFLAELERKLAGTVWNAGGCRSWYLDREGRNFTLWPGSALSYRRRVRSFQPGEYLAEARRALEAD